MNKKKIMNAMPIIITVFILIVGSIVYFTVGSGMDGKSMGKSQDNSIYGQMKIKAAISSKNELKIFALADDSAISKYKISEGRNIPENDSVIMGFEEAMMMRDDNLFSNISDELTFFGIKTKVQGILEMTDTPIDNFHFLSEKQYLELKGKEGKLFIKISSEGKPKLFYKYNLNDTSLKFNLSDGNMNDYNSVDIDGKTYVPIILGAKEAEMMKEEKLFSKTGDKMEGFFGTNAVVIGIIEPTDTALDMIHMIPLDEKQFG